MSGKEKCRRFHDACIDGNGGVFVWASACRRGGGYFAPFSKVPLQVQDSVLQSYP